jgi:hypothetical protein
MRELVAAAVAGMLAGCAPARPLPVLTLVIPVTKGPAPIIVAPTMPSLATPSPSASARAPNECRGRNACKGQGNCKTEAHDCKGKNECKGQGGCGA